MLPRDMSSPWVAEADEAEAGSEDGYDEFEEDDEYDEDVDEYAEFEEEFEYDEPRPHPHRRSEDWD